MIPISDELPSRRVPVVTYGLIALNVVVFFFELLLGPNVDSLYMTLGAVPARVTDPVNHPLAVVTLFTSIFIHGGWAHLLGNMLYLWIFGDNVEDILGRAGYVVFYVAAGLAAGLMQVFVAPSSQVPAIGASGAIAGVLAVYLVLFPTAPVRVLVPFFYMIRIVRLPAVIVLGMWFVIQLFNGVMSLGTLSVATGGVAWFAHIGGFISGLLVGFVLRLLWRRPPPPRRTY
ncbi:MAG: rhomboid family intramembrane serine protease [Anaerolineae bacterium]|jgi:membrane associated rhomboid family serine protease